MRAAVQLPLRHDVVSGGEKGEQRGRDGGHARGEGLGRLTSLQCGNGPGEPVAGGVVDPAVRVAPGVVLHDRGKRVRGVEREGGGAVHGSGRGPAQQAGPVFRWVDGAGLQRIIVPMIPAHPASPSAEGADTEPVNGSGRLLTMPVRVCTGRPRRTQYS